MGTILAVAALLLAAGAALYAWTLQQGLDQATRRLDRYNRALFDANDEIRRLREDHATQLASLRGEVARLSGNVTFEPAMTVREVYAMHPQAQDVLAGFHLGGCSSCAVSLDDRLEQVCHSSGLPVGDVISSLNALFAPNTNGHRGEIQHVKLPNIELNI